MKTINGIEFDIKDLLLSGTNFCLGSCVYCNLHKLDAFDYEAEWQMPHLKRLLTDPMLDGLTNVHLTGGEFLLSPKLYPTVKLLAQTHPNIRANMSISGFFPEVSYKYLKKLHPILPQLRIDISVDGPRDIHEKDRGRGAYDAVMRTIEYLRTIEGLQIQLQFTVMESNYQYLRWVWDLAQSMDLGCYVCFPRYGTRFGHKDDASHEHSKEVIACIDEQVKDTWCALRPLNKQTWTIQKAIWEGKRVEFDCSMWRHSIDVSPIGDVYPCMMYMKDFSYGNIKTASLSEMFEVRGANIADRIYQQRKCQPCPMPVCPWKHNFTIDGVACDFGRAVNY